VYCASSVELRSRGGSQVPNQENAFQSDAVQPDAFQTGLGHGGSFEDAAEEVFFYQLAGSQDPRRFEGVASLVENTDLTLEEALARFSRANPENVRAIHQRAAGVIGVMDRFFQGLTEAELLSWLWQALATDDIGVLTAYRTVLDGHPSHVTEIAAIEEWRLVVSGLFRRDGTERNPWYRELLGHRWLDEQLERRGRLPPPRFVLVLGTSEVAVEVARALGPRGRDYGLMLRGHEIESQDELVRRFFWNLPSEVPRASRAQVILDVNSPAATQAGALGATLVHLDGEEPHRIVERAHAVIDASDRSDGSRALVERAQSNGIPIFQFNFRDGPRDVSVRALQFLDERFHQPMRK
jgi:hypothetical protein